MDDAGFVMSAPPGLRVKREPGGEIVSVPEYLQVEQISSSNGQDHFTALEGVHRGNKFSVAAGHLSKHRPEYRGAAHLTFSLTRGLITYALGAWEAITHPDNPIPVGVHRKRPANPS